MFVCVPAKTKDLHLPPLAHMNAHSDGRACIQECLDVDWNLENGDGTGNAWVARQAIHHFISSSMLFGGM